LGGRDQSACPSRGLGCRDCGIPVKALFRATPTALFRATHLFWKDAFYWQHMINSMFYFEQNVCTILQIEFMTSTNLSLVCFRFTESLFKPLLYIMISL
jgi:hypothetical protein